MEGEFEREEELEFFGFLPSEFHLSVYRLLERALESRIGSIPSARQDIDRAESSIERNMLIFERFTLRNIFTFPESFIYDRRVESEELKRDVSARQASLEYSALREEVRACREEILRKASIASELAKKEREVQSIDGVEDVLVALKELSSLVKSTREIRRKVVLGEGGAEKKDDSRGRKEAIESELRRRECTEAERRVPMEVLAKVIEEWKRQ